MAVDQDQLVLGRQVDLEGITRWLLHPGRENFSARLVQRMENHAANLWQEMSGKMEPGDELRLCRSAIYDPAALYGNDGLAIVRAGVIVEYRVVRDL